MKQLSDILNKIKTSTDQEQLLFAQVEQAKSSSTGDREAQLKRFNDSYLYYTSKLPGNIEGDQFTSGTAQDYVEPVLYNAVKAALPQLLDTFTEDESLAVSFRSKGFRKNPMIESLVDYNINKVFLRDQDGYQTLENLMKETLISGDSIAKVFVDETIQHDTDKVKEFVELSEYMQGLDEGWTIDAPQDFGTKKKGNAKGLEWEEHTEVVQDPQTQEWTTQPIILIKGNIPLYKREKKLVVEQCNPEDLWIDTSYGHDFTRCRYICHRIKTTVGEAEARGFDPDKLAAATDEKYDSSTLPEMYFSPSLYSEPAGAASKLERNTSTDPKERAIDLYEHYIYSSLLDKRGETRCYQVTATRAEILQVQEIKRFPFVHGQCEVIPGSFFSRSFFDIAKPFQDNLSLAYRLALQTAKLTAYPAWLTVKGQFDRQSLLNASRPGSVVEQMSAGAIERLPALQLPDTFFQTFQALQESATGTLAQPVGAASLEGGIPQVAAATVAMSLYQEAQKGMILSKTIARTLIKPLYELIYLIIKDEGFELETPDGQKVEGEQLPSVYEFVVDIDTTNDEMAQAMQLTQIATFVAQISQMPTPVIQPDKLYNMAIALCDRFDLDGTQYFTNPADNQDPHAQAEQAEQQAIASEMGKVQLQQAIVNMRKTAAEVAHIEAQTEEHIKDSHVKRLAKQTEDVIKLQKVKSDDARHQADAQIRSQDVAVKAQEVAVKNKAVNYEAVLTAAKHQADIAMPNINGIR